MVNTDSNSLSVIDAERNAVVATISLHNRPYFVDVSPDGKRAVVANAGSANVSVIDLEQRKEIAAVAAGHQPGVARISPDGKIAVVSNRQDGTVSVLDLNAVAVRSTVTVCPTPEEVAILADGSAAFVSCSSTNQVAVAALHPTPAASVRSESAATGSSLPSTKRNRQHLRNVPMTPRATSGGADKLITILDVGKTPLHIALKPDGGEVFVSNFGSNSVSEIITGTNEVSSTHLLGAGPVRSVISADDSLLYVSSFASNSVAIYDIDRGKLVQTIQVGEHPDALAFTPSGHYLLVADSGSGDVAVIRHDAQVNANLLFTMIPVGLEPRQIAIKNFMLRKPTLEMP